MISLSEFMYQVGWFRLKEKEYEKIYLFHGLEVKYYNCTAYVEVTGKVPYIFAKKIYEWDPEFIYEIYPGGSYKSNPANSATSIELEELNEKWKDEWKRKKVSIDEWREASTKKINELLKEKPESMYIELYTINTSNGLRAFLEKATEFYEGCKK